jgi:hypothetical protein
MSGTGYCLVQGRKTTPTQKFPKLFLDPVLARPEKKMPLMYHHGYADLNKKEN